MLSRKKMQMCVSGLNEGVQNLVQLYFITENPEELGLNYHTNYLVSCDHQINVVAWAHSI